MLSLCRTVGLRAVFKNSRGSNVPKCGSSLYFSRRSHIVCPRVSLDATTHLVGPSLGFSRVFQTPHNTRTDYSIKLTCDRATLVEIWSHLVRFSRSSPRDIRSTYFPRSPGGRPPNGNSLFSKFTAAVNALPSGVVLWTVLGLNGFVYLLWNIGIEGAERHRDASMLTFLLKNFTLSWQNWKEGRFWTVLTSCFSNQATSHILLNALTFYFMAPPVLQILGNASFLSLYLGGGVVSSLITLYFNEHFLKQPRIVHGASGAIYAVISFMASAAPKATFLVFGIIPVPAWGCVVGLFTWDLLNAISHRQTGVSEPSHISGILFGIVYFFHKTGRLPRFF